MDEMEIIKLVFGILLSLGAITLLLIAFKVFYKYLVQEKKCTAKVEGIIRKYTLMNHGGVFLPVVFYIVNGKEYKVVGPEYKACKIVTRCTPLSENSMEYREENQVLKIYRTANSFVGIHRNPLERLYPRYSAIDVYYDPKNPKLAYVLRFCNKKWMFWLMFCCAVFVLILDVIIIFI